MFGWAAGCDRQDNVAQVEIDFQSYHFTSYSNLLDHFSYHVIRNLRHFSNDRNILVAVPAEGNQ
jgi:hypothetical protein